MLERRIGPQILAALADTPVAFLAGPRQAGKSTLVRALCEGRLARRYLTLDDARTRAAAVEDPEGFLAALAGPVAIDEVQRAPGLFPAIKHEVDRARQPGRFLLTGSADLRLVPDLARELVGRMEILTLWPLAQAEIDGRGERFVDGCFADTLPAMTAAAGDRRDLIRRVVRGGYPEAVTRTSADRRDRWFGAYLDTMLQREIRDLAEIERGTDLPRLLSLCAARSGGLANLSELSRASSLPLTTLRRYLGLFETLFLIHTIPAWSGNLARRVVRAPRLALADSGLLCHLRGIDEAGALARPDELGPLLESFVCAEVRRLAGWSRARPRLLHFRTHGGDEVDLVLEDARGRLVGIEVKATATARPGDMRGLRAFADALPRRVHRGILLYTGREVVAYGPRLHALPISALWTMHGAIPAAPESR